MKFGRKAGAVLFLAVLTTAIWNSSGTPAAGQVGEPQKWHGRYQLNVLMSGTGSGSGPLVYMTDTDTGECWVRFGDAPWRAIGSPVGIKP